jgi:hypothetical protein
VIFKNFFARGEELHSAKKFFVGSLIWLSAKNLCAGASSLPRAGPLTLGKEPLCREPGLWLSAKPQVHGSKVFFSRPEVPNRRRPVPVNRTGSIGNKKTVEFKTQIKTRSSNGSHQYTDRFDRFPVV